MPSSESAGVVVERLTKSFGSTRALSGVDFAATPGRIMGLLGPNGAGKSTTLKCLLGLCRPDSGTALVDGRPYAQHAHPSTVGAALDAQDADPTMRGRDHLRVYAAMGGHPDSRVGECIAALDMHAYAHRRIGGWSTGMRQRLALATALLGDPGTVVLDEPTNGLDPNGIDWVREFLRDMAGQGRTVLVSSHVLAEFEGVMHDVTIIRGGRTVATGPVEELFDRSGVTTLEDLYRSTSREVQR